MHALPQAAAAAAAAAAGPGPIALHLQSTNSIWLCPWSPQAPGMAALSVVALGGQAAAVRGAPVGRSAQAKCTTKPRVRRRGNKPCPSCPPPLGLRPGCGAGLHIARSHIQTVDPTRCRPSRPLSAVPRVDRRRRRHCRLHCRLQVLRVRAAAAAEQEAAETGNFAEEFTREIVDEEKK